MTLEYHIHKIQDRFEATTELRWYGQYGYYKISVLGFGKTEATAKESALSMAIRARSELQLATVDDSSNRVPETSTENAHDRTDDRRQQPA